MIDQLKPTKPFSAQAFSSDVITKSFVVQNSTDHAFLGWIPTAVTFAKGERFDLSGLGLNDRPFEMKPIKHYPDGSVAIAQVKAAYLLQPGEMGISVLEELKTPFPLSKQWHPAVMDFLGAHGIRIRAEFNGEAIYADPVSDYVAELMHDGAHSLCARTRRLFKTGFPAQDRQITLTTYGKVESHSPIIEFTFVIGNDQRDVASGNGVQLNNITVECAKPFEIYQRASFGNMSALLGDGQTLAFKVYVNTDPSVEIFNSTLRAKGQAQFIGLQAYNEHQSTQAMLSHAVIPNPRFVFSDTLTVRTQLENQYKAHPLAQAKDNLGFINLNPPNTGAQPDFASTVPVDIQKGMQAYSQSVLSRVFAGVMRECWRPSFFWLPNHTRPRSTDFIELFFWSGRPHFDRSWNPNYPEWNNRVGIFFTGHGGWGGMDNQHWSNTHLRAMYELTGDEYLGDICRYYITIAHWNFFTKWLTHIEAERATRTMKDALALTELFHGSAESQELRARIQQKRTYYFQDVSANIAGYGIAAAAPFDACDPRVVNGAWCPLPPANPNIAIVGWQTGFHMEFEATQDAPDLRYLTDAPKYFLPDGQPKTYLKLTDQGATYVTGGIGIPWWAGWVSLALANPGSPNEAFVLGAVKTKLNEAVEANRNGYFSHYDSFKSWL